MGKAISRMCIFSCQNVVIQTLSALLHTWMTVRNQVLISWILSLSWCSSTSESIHLVFAMRLSTAKRDTPVFNIMSYEDTLKLKSTYRTYRLPIWPPWTNHRSPVGFRANSEKVTWKLAWTSLPCISRDRSLPWTKRLAERIFEAQCFWVCRLYLCAVWEWSDYLCGWGSEESRANNTHLPRDRQKDREREKEPLAAKEIKMSRTVNRLRGPASKTDIVPWRRVMLQSPAGINDNIFNHLGTQMINRYLVLIICTLVILNLLPVINNSCPKITKLRS